MSIDFVTGNSAHQAIIYSSEGQRQSDLAAAQAKWGALMGADPIAEIAAAVRIAEIAHYRRLYASAIANNANSAPYIDALRSFGASVYP